MCPIPDVRRNQTVAEENGDFHPTRLEPSCVGGVVLACRRDRGVELPVPAPSRFLVHGTSVPRPRRRCRAVPKRAQQGRTGGSGMVDRGDGSRRGRSETAGGLHGRLVVEAGRAGSIPVTRTTPVAAVTGLKG